MSGNPVVKFYILAMGISWLGWMPVVMGSHGIGPFDPPYFQILLLFPALGPMLAAMWVIAKAHGKARVGGLFKPLFQWRFAPGWLLVALLAPLTLFLLARSLTGWLGLPVIGSSPRGELLSVAVSAFLVSSLSNPWEEVGWRGFALPRLQERYAAWVASLILGVFWGLWHLPLFFWKGNPMADYPFFPWFAGIVALSFLYTWLYNSTQGSLLVTSLFHIFLNTFAAVISGVSVLALAMVYILAALLLVALFGGTHLSWRERVCAR